MGDATTTKKMKRLIYTFYPYILIGCLWFLFAIPFLFLGKVPYASTYQVTHFSPWASYEQFRGPVKNGAMPDVVDQIYPWRYFSIQTWKSGQIPLWNPYSFSGTPHLANYQSATLSPLNVLFFFLPFVTAWSLLVLLQPLFAAIGMYLFLETKKMSKNAALLGSISFMFCGFLTAWRDYGTLGYAILVLPLALFFTEKLFRTKNTFYGIGLAMCFPLSFFSGHFQTSIYFAIFTVTYILFSYMSTKNKRMCIYSLLFVICGILLCSPQILPSIEFYSQSFRSGLYQAGDGIPWQYIPTVFAPDVYGNPVTRNDWFGQYAEWSSFIGVIPLLLAVLALFQKRNGTKLFFIVTAILSLLLAYDTILVDFLISLHIPVLSTSATNRIIVVFSFSLCVLAAYGYDEFISIIKTNENKMLFQWGLTSTLLVISFGMILFFFVPQEKMVIARNNVIIPFALFLSVGLLVCVSKIKKNLIFFIPLVILFLTSFDLLRFTTKWEPFDPKHLVFADVPVTDFIQTLDKTNRAIGNYGAEVSVYYGLSSLGGYDALYIKRYGEFVSFLANGRIDLQRSVVEFPKRGTHVDKAMQLLRVNYVIHKTSDNGLPWTFPFWDYPEKTFTKLFADSKYEIYKNNNNKPTVFLVGNALTKRPDEQLRILFSNDFDIYKSVLLEDGPEQKTVTDKIGTASFVTYLPNSIVIHVHAIEKGFLFLGDPFYPGWKASIGNKEIPIYRADYAFRAVPIKPGEYDVTLTYEPKSLQRGVGLATVGIVGIVSVILFSVKRKAARLM